MAENHGVSRFKPQDVYPALIVHQTRADESDVPLTEDWTYHELVAYLEGWCRRFIAHFRLEIPVPPLNIERLRKGRNGHYRSRNGFGLRGEVAISTLQVERGKAEMLATLLHELVHLWQDRHGRPGSGNYHNGEFRRKAEELGLQIDARGRRETKIAGPFAELLAEHGIEVEAPPPPQPGEAKEKQKLKLWVCECDMPKNGKPTQRARIGKSEFHAVCAFCRKRFRRVDC